MSRTRGLTIKKTVNLSSINTEETESSYTSICNICFEKLRERCFPDCCLHKFCNKCLHQWAEMRTDCPVCRRPFKGWTIWPCPSTQEWNANELSGYSWQIKSSEFRRKVYARNVWVQDLSDVSEYREFTPEFYRADKLQVNRITPWLNREAFVLLHYVGSDSIPYNYVVDLILTSVLPYHSILSREFKPY